MTNEMHSIFSLLVVISLLIFLTGAIVSLLTLNRAGTSTAFGTGGAVLASMVGLIPAGAVLFTGKVLQLTFPWSIPGGSFSIGLDPLSALFLLPLFIVTLSSALFGSEYLPLKKRSSGLAWFAFNFLALSMMLVVLSRNGILFLMSWEIMSLSSLALVIHDHEDQKVQKAGWVYFIATHAGTAFLFPFFFILAKWGGSFEFSSIAIHGIKGWGATLLFVLAVIGFGCKAGFMPFHVWLPEAHPAAPSHVSALMSGVMIKMGIYGLLRTLTFLETPHVSWGITLTAIGLISGCLGILFALSQHDLKRLLAYSSVENIGIIASGIGIGLIGASCNLPFIAAAGFAGALLHVVNHSFFKGLLFLIAGAVVHATGTRDIEKLGGIIKKMPLAGFSFLVGSVAICGLPPLNGFVSEFLIYSAGLTGIASSFKVLEITGLIVTTLFALIGGLAVVAFTKSFGIVFLGEPRTDYRNMHFTYGKRMKSSFIILSVACVLSAAGFVFVIPVLAIPVSQLSSINVSAVVTEFGHVRGYLAGILLISSLLICISSIILVARQKLLKGREKRFTGTWDCGYAAPDSRMQYTSSSFVEPVANFFRAVLNPHRKISSPQGYFPHTGTFKKETNDIFMDLFYIPVFKNVTKAFLHLRWLQAGKIHVYVGYIAFTIIAALMVIFTI
jgi:hydrogenase-4 component B